MPKPETSTSQHEIDENIEDKRRKNVLDNQNFLETLRLGNLRDDFKSMINSTKIQPKKHNRKETTEPTEKRRSSRIRSILERQPPKPIEMSPPYRKKRKSMDDSFSEDEIDEDNDVEELVVKVKGKKDRNDREWRPSYWVAIPSRSERESRTIRNGVKIFHPNIGLKASTVLSTKNTQNKSKHKNKANVAISSSDED